MNSEVKATVIKVQTDAILALPSFRMQHTEYIDGYAIHLGTLSHNYNTLPDGYSYDSYKVPYNCGLSAENRSL